MKLSWTNSEWDNFNGVSKDNLMMLNAGDDLLNAGGIFGNKLQGTGEAIIDKKTYTGRSDSYELIIFSNLSLPIKVPGDSFTD